jgi:ecotin
MNKNSLILGLIFMVITSGYSQKNATKISHDLKMFPTAEEGFKRVVISLKPQENETNFKVEIYGGITAEVDCNKHSLAGEFIQQNLKGWGYHYYEFETNGMLLGTLMGCPDDSKHKEFVKSKPELLRYNSKLPIVIYVPNNYTIKYKIWQRNTQELEAIVE